MRIPRRLVTMLIVTGVVLTGSAFAQSGQSGPSNESGSSSMSLIGVMPSHEEVRAVQEALKARGYDPGPIDGVLGRKKAELNPRFFQRYCSRLAAGPRVWTSAGRPWDWQSPRCVLVAGVVIA